MPDTPQKSRRRLQRDQDFTGARLTSFRQVFLRHGWPGCGLALLCVALPNMFTVFSVGIEKGLAAPAQYGLAALLIFGFLNVYAWQIDRRWSAAKFGWIIYLGALSFWEEWVFRVAVPYMLEAQGASLWVAATISALIFSVAHFFTLRWKWHWCIGAFVGSLALSGQMERHGDLLLITAFHWVATYLNTPRPPGQSSHGAAK